MRQHRRLLVIALAITFGGCAVPAAQPHVERGITVTGRGQVATRPDAAAVAVGVEARMAQLAGAIAEVEQLMRRVVARLKDIGVRDADVQTVQYTVDPIAEPRGPGDPGARIVGYRVSNVVEVRTRDVDGLGRIVDGAMAAGANVVRDIRFMLADPTRAEAEATARAVQDARRKAAHVAATAGVRLGPLVSLTESSPPVRPVARMSMATAPGPIQAGELEVTVVVQARYAIEP